MRRAKLMGPSRGQRPRLSTTQPRLSRPRPTTPSWLNLSGPSPIPRGLVGARFRLNRSVSGAGTRGMRDGPQRLSVRFPFTLLRRSRPITRAAKDGREKRKNGPHSKTRCHRVKLSSASQLFRLYLQSNRCGGGRRKNGRKTKRDFRHNGGNRPWQAGDSSASREQSGPSRPIVA